MEEPTPQMKGKKRSIVSEDESNKRQKLDTITFSEDIHIYIRTPNTVGAPKKMYLFKQSDIYSEIEKLFDNQCRNYAIYDSQDRMLQGD